MNSVKFNKLATKFISFIAISFLCISTGCKQNEIVNPILGTWKYVSDTYRDCDDGAPTIVENYTCTSSDCRTVTLKEEGKLTFEITTAGTKATSNGTYTIENSQLTMCTTGCREPAAFTIDGSTLSLIWEDDAGCNVTTVLEKIS